DMTDDKKHDDKDRKKLSDEEMEDLAGGTGNFNNAHALEVPDVKGKGKRKGGLREDQNGLEMHA
ncbi:MAG: hypothetical protein AAEJ46_04165, partial [Planctomycetota bacterium]